MSPVKYDGPCAIACALCGAIIAGQTPRETARRLLVHDCRPLPEDQLTGIGGWDNEDGWHGC